MMDASSVSATPRAIRQPGVGSGSEASLRKAAQDFEAQFFGFMLQPMFATVDMSKSAFGGGHAEAQWRPMLVDAIANSTVRSSGLGIADIVYRELLRNRGSQTPNMGEIQP